MRIAALDALAAWGFMFGERDPLGLRSDSADMSDEVARIEFDIDLVFGLADFHPPPDPGDRYRVANGVHRDVSFHVHRALMQAIHFGNPRWQRFQMHAFDREQLARHRADMFLVSGVDLVAPLACLLI